MALGRTERGLEWTDRAIALAERADARRPLVDALITRAWAVDAHGRPARRSPSRAGPCISRSGGGSSRRSCGSATTSRPGLEFDPAVSPRARRRRHRALPAGTASTRGRSRSNCSFWTCGSRRELGRGSRRVRGDGGSVQRATALDRARGHTLVATLRGDFPAARTWFAEVEGPERRADEGQRPRRERDLRRDSRARGGSVRRRVAGRARRGPDPGEPLRLDHRCVRRVPPARPGAHAGGRGRGRGGDG